MAPNTLSWLVLTLLVIPIVGSCSKERGKHEGNEPALVETAKIEIAFDAAIPETRAETETAYRRLDIPPRAHGYSNFKTQTFYTQVELEDFLSKHYDTHSLWGLNKGVINFGPEALVLLRGTSASGSDVLTLEAPSLTAKKLAFPLRTGSPRGMGTDDMAYYCYAVIIDTAKVDNVVLVDGGRVIVPHPADNL